MRFLIILLLFTGSMGAAECSIENLSGASVFVDDGTNLSIVLERGGTFTGNLLGPQVSISNSNWTQLVNVNAGKYVIATVSGPVVAEYDRFTPVWLGMGLAGSIFGFRMGVRVFTRFLGGSRQSMTE